MANNLIWIARELIKLLHFYSVREEMIRLSTRFELMLLSIKIVKIPGVGMANSCKIQDYVFYVINKCPNFFAIVK